MAKKKSSKASNPLPNYISEKEQENLYLAYYSASKPLVSAENKQDLRDHFKKADTLHLENNCKETFIQWVLRRFNKVYSDKPDTFKQALVQLYHFGLNFDLPSREGFVIFIDMIRFNYLTATDILINTLNAQILPNHVLDIVDDNHPLFIAWRHPDKAMFHLILNELNHLTDGRDTPMTLAARYGNVDALKYMHHLGFSIAAADAHSMTPLMHAFMSGHHPCVLQLIQSGADLFAKNKYNETAFHFAFKCPQTDELFDNATFSMTLLQLAKRSADLLDINGLHPIHLAIAANASRWVKRFLDDDPSLLLLTDSNGFSLAYHALQANSLELLRYFHDDLHLALKLEGGFPLFDYAVEKEYLAIARYLHSINEAPLYPTRERPMAPLFRALGKKDPAMLEWILTIDDLDNDHFIRNYRASSYSLAFFLVKYNQLQSLITFDLFGKNIEQLLYKNAYGITCLDRFLQLITAKKPTPWDELDQQFFLY